MIYFLVKWRITQKFSLLLLGIYEMITYSDWAGRLGDTEGLGSRVQWTSLGGQLSDSSVRDSYGSSEESSGSCNDGSGENDKGELKETKIKNFLVIGITNKTAKFTFYITLLYFSVLFPSENLRRSWWSWLVFYFRRKCKRLFSVEVSERRWVLDAVLEVDNPFYTKKFRVHILSRKLHLNPLPIWSFFFLNNYPLSLIKSKRYNFF